jgi:hypothetical protein
MSKDFRAPAARTTLKVGHYGCTEQIVKVSCVVEKGHRAPHSAEVDCPACRLTHPVQNLMWRTPHSADEFELAEVKLSE